MTVYRLPDHLRPRLQKPMGHLVKTRDVNRESISREFESAPVKVAVGDATTEKLLALGFKPDVEVVDGREMRVTRALPSSNYKTELKTSNPPGCLTRETLQVIAEALNLEKPVRILVEGEEDLLVLPLLALYPAGTVVAYGQPRTGMVFIRLDEEVRRLVFSILGEMGLLLE